MIASTARFSNDRKRRPHRHMQRLRGLPTPVAHCSKCTHRCLDMLRILGCAARSCAGPGQCCYHRQRQKGSKSHQIHRQALQQKRTPMRGCAAHPSAAPGRRCCLCYGELRPRSQQIRRQALMFGRAAHSSAASGRHGCLRHGSIAWMCCTFCMVEVSRQRQKGSKSRQIHRQPLQQMRTPMRGCAAHPWTALLSLLW